LTAERTSTTGQGREQPERLLGGVARARKYSACMPRRKRKKERSERIGKEEGLSNLGMERVLPRDTLKDTTIRIVRGLEIRGRKGHGGS